MMVPAQWCRALCDISASLFFIQQLSLCACVCVCVCMRVCGNRNRSTHAHSYYSHKHSVAVGGSKIWGLTDYHPG